MDKGLTKDNAVSKIKDSYSQNNDFVLNKSIFSKVFGKDIQRVYLYKKAERIAKALHLVSPAFKTSAVLKDKIERIAVALIEASTLPPDEAREPLSRELLSLQGVLELGKSSGALSAMNADIIMREALHLLHEISLYETPAVHFAETPSLAALSRVAGGNAKGEQKAKVSYGVGNQTLKEDRGNIKDKVIKDNRKEEIIAVLRTKGPVYIKDISTMIRGISEKTVQRELLSMVSSGEVIKSGKRRWTKYELP